jgi:hypothetical protein
MASGVTNYACNQFDVTGLSDHHLMQVVEKMAA